SPYGSASPITTNPDTGKPYGPQFPPTTIRDDVRIHKLVLDHLGVKSVAVAIGGSMGGMAVLEWPLCSPPGYIRHVIPLATSARHSAWCISWGEAQRQSIYSDPLYQDGFYSTQPASGLAAARMSALLTYRSRDSFESRFGRKPQLGRVDPDPDSTNPDRQQGGGGEPLEFHNDGHRNATRRSPEPPKSPNNLPSKPSIFSAQSYLRYQGDKFIARFDANCYIHITRKMDTHDVARGRAVAVGESQALAQILATLPPRALVISIETDGLFTTTEQRELAAHIPDAELVVIPSPDGHDGFLLEFKQIDMYVQRFLRREFPEIYEKEVEVEVDGDFEVKKTSVFGEAEVDITRWQDEIPNITKQYRVVYDVLPAVTVPVSNRESSGRTPSRRLLSSLNLWTRSKLSTKYSTKSRGSITSVMSSVDSEVAPNGLTNGTTNHEAPESVTTQFDPLVFRSYLLALLPPVIGADPSELESLFDEEFEEKVSRFATDSTSSMYVVKIKEEVEDDALPIYTYELTPHLVYHPTHVTTLALIKRGHSLDPLTPLASQLHMMNLFGGEDTPYEGLHAVVSSGVKPWFDAFVGARSSGRDGGDTRMGIPMTKKKFAELELALLHLQQNVEIPETHLVIHPVIQRAVEQANSTNTPPNISNIPPNLLNDSTFLNSLQAHVNSWIKAIQAVTKLNRDVASGTASQEINFWLSLERALDGIETQLRSDEVNMVINCLRNAKRFRATVSFIADTGLKDATDMVHKYNQLMKDFPLNELLSATDLDKIEESLTLIFAHINRKLKLSPYPIRRALPLVEAISRDFKLRMQGTEIWVAAENAYNERVSRVENQIIARLRDRLGTARNANEMFRVFSKFNALFVRPKIRGAIQEYQTQLIDSVKEDIKHLHDKMRDLPPIAGAIIWARQIERQLLTYMKRVEDVLGKGWELYAEGQKLQSESTAFRKKLETRPVFDAWLHDINRRNMSVDGRLFEIVRLRGGGFQLAVNFDPQIITLFKEVRNLLWLNFQVPHAITNMAKDAKKVYPHAVSLMETVRTYGQTLDLVENNKGIEWLVAEYRNESQRMISKGEGFLLFTGLDYADANDPQDKTNNVIDLYKDITRSVEDLATCSYTTEAFSELLSKVQAAIDRLNLEGYANLEHWVAELDKKIEDILLQRLTQIIHVWCTEFDRVDDNDLRRDTLPLRDILNKRRGDKRSKEERFLEGNMTLKPIVHEIRIQNQVIFLDPPIEYARANWIQQLHDWLGVVCRLRRIQSSRYEIGLQMQGATVTEMNYTSLLTRFSDNTLERPFSLIEMKVQQLKDYVAKWLQFQSLWDLEAEYVFNRLGDSLANWQQLLTEIKKARSTFDTSETQKSFGVCIIDYEQVQARVNAKYDAWQRDILSRFGVKLGNVMKEMHASILKARNDLEHQSIEGLVGGTARRF
ncbi:hypothetical protein H0H93_006940, partial [Arthromyces matolae]